MRAVSCVGMETIGNVGGGEWPSQAGSEQSSWSAVGCMERGLGTRRTLGTRMWVRTPGMF